MYTFIMCMSNYPIMYFATAVTNYGELSVCQWKCLQNYVRSKWLTYTWTTHTPADLCVLAQDNNNSQAHTHKKAYSI